VCCIQTIFFEGRGWEDCEISKTKFLCPSKNENKNCRPQKLTQSLTPQKIMVLLANGRVQDWNEGKKKQKRKGLGRR